MGDRLGIHGAVDILATENREDSIVSGTILEAKSLGNHPSCLTYCHFALAMAGCCPVSVRWRWVRWQSSDIARQMAGRGRDRAGGDFCFSAFLSLAKAPSPALGAQNSWTPAGEGKTEALTEQFDKYRGLDLKMDPRLSSGLVAIWRDQHFV